MKMLDLSKFEKIGEDKDTTKMRHKDGHEMTIMHAKLPRLHREQLKRLKMADGGPVAQDPNKPWTQNDKKDFEKGASGGDVTLGQAYDNAKKSLGFAKGGVAHFKDGGDTSKLDIEPINPNSQDAQPDPSSRSTQSTTGDSGQSDQQMSAQPFQGIPFGGNPLQQQAENVLGAQNLNATGLNQEAAAKGAMSSAAVPVERQRIQNAEDTKRALNDNASVFLGATQDTSDFMKNNPGVIDRTHFMRSMPDEQKALTALGLLVGGFTGGFNGTGNNPAMNWLKDQQEKDIAAQQKSWENGLEGQKTVLGAYQQLFNNREAAIEAARVTDNDRNIHQLQQIADTQGTPLAYAHAKMAQAKLINDNTISTQKAAGYLLNNPPPAAQQAQQQSGPSGPAKAPAESRQMMGQPGNAQQAQTQLTPDEQILTPAAQKKYAGLQYDTALSDTQKDKIAGQYLNAGDADKTLTALKGHFNDMKNHANWGGYLANKIDPRVAGGLGIGAAEALTGGGGGIGMIPVGVAGAAAGTALGAGLKQGLRAIGGQEQTKYDDAAEAFDAELAQYAKSSGLTPTQVGEVVGQFRPTINDMRDPATVDDMWRKVVDKVRTMQPTRAIKDYEMTNLK
jgi:hypothetical protein